MPGTKYEGIAPIRIRQCTAQLVLKSALDKITIHEAFHSGIEQRLIREREDLRKGISKWMVVLHRLL